MRDRRDDQRSSRSFHSVTSGVAMKIEEYAPAARPAKSASASSRSVCAPSRNDPTNNRLPTGISEMIEVLNDRNRTWFSASLAASEYVTRPAADRPVVRSFTRSKMTTVSYRE
jgi:hypothetical protein